MPSDEPSPIPGQEEPVPGVAEPVPGLEGPVPGLEGPVPGLDEPVPGLAEPVTGLAEPVPALAEPVPGLEGPVPALAEPVPGLEQPVPGLAEPVPGLAEQHLRALAVQHVTDLRSLVQADQHVIYRAMANLRPRPTLVEISRWQDEARSRLEQADTNASGWRTAASFVVVFRQRQTGEVLERRLEVERTEVEPERNLQIWTGWDCEPICVWMLGQLGQDDGAEPGREATIAEAQPAEDRAGSPVTGSPVTGSPVTGSPGDRGRLRIESAAIIDATARTDVVSAGAVVAHPPTEFVAPVRVVFTVSGARPDSQVQAVTRIMRRDGPGWNPQDPVVVPRSGLAEFDLSSVPAGEHELSLIAWAPDATANPVSVALPGMTIRPG